jgi:hypothetical protein
VRQSPNDPAPSVRVVEVVAEAEGVDPLSLSPPLAAYVDPDALDTLLDGATGSISFEAWDYRVTVTDGGSVTLSPADATAEESRPDLVPPGGASEGHEPPE